VRAFFEALEQGTFTTNVRALAALVGAHGVEALRRAGILRETDDADVEEISYPDLARALRKLFGCKARGYPLPRDLVNEPGLIGWAPGPRGEREVVVVLRPVPALRRALPRSRTSLLLVPTPRSITAALRASHGPGAWIEIQSLEETVTVHDGRLARVAPGANEPPAVAPDVPRSERTPASRPASSRDPAPAAAPPLAPAPAAARAPRAPRTRARTPALPPEAFVGLKRWNQMRICKVDALTVRVDLPTGFYRLSCFDLGMAHTVRRQPLREWELLIDFCDEYGVFKKFTYGKADATKKLVSRLGKMLQAALRLRTRPFDRYRTGVGWRARFQALPSPPRDRIA